MAIDQPDWTLPVNITAGSVTISGTANVSVTNTPSVTVSGTASVNVANTPAVTISGTPTVNIGNTPAVTISGTPTVNIGNTPAVTISGTPSVTISSGSVAITGPVSITGTPTINITQASGLPMYGPNLLPVNAQGPITGTWAALFNATVVLNAAGTLTTTAPATDGTFGMRIQTPTGTAGIPVQRGQLHFVATVKASTRNDNVQLTLFEYDITGAQIAFQQTGNISTPVGTWVTATGDFTLDPSTYYVSFAVIFPAVTAGDQYVVADAFIGVVGAVSIAGKVQVAGAVSTNPNTLLSASAASGQAVITPIDQTIFFVGAIVQLSAAAGGAGFLGQVKSVNPSGTVTLTANLTAAFVAGDVAQVLPLQLATSRKRAWDWTGFQQAAQGSGFQVIIAGVTGQKLILNHLDYILINTNAAGATGVGVTVRDNASNGTILWASDSGILGTTGDKDRCTEPDLALAGLVGHNLYYQEEANIANTTSSGTCGGYQAIAEPV